MSALVVKAVDAVLNGTSAYCKFLSANDSGETGGHQSGILISKTAKDMLYTEQEMNENHILKKSGSVKWQDDFITPCTFTWYESKGELRITGFGRNFPFRHPDYTGALFVMVKDGDEYYQGFIFNTDETIQEFLDSFGLTPAETNRPIEINNVDPEIRERSAIDAFISELGGEFPSSYEMSRAARMIQYDVYLNRALVVSNPDSILLRWTEEEYRLFRAIEHSKYGDIVANGFQSVDDFVVLANQVLNRRKSRAGKSLEHHLSAIFDENSIQYTAQAVTEGNKKPDFLFPSEESYHDMTFSIDKLCTLAAKTTCKDRWRQILNEANRLRDENKYLCTMQQGISAPQMDEMQAEKVILVVPKDYITAYPRDRRDRIWTVGKFVNYVKEMEGLL
ncbi:MAG: type II restriction endonuclease [Oscillospiraceae bacterium]|nr:type II restriction endonuclease [Oscillospiraceae bacterium]